MKRSFIYCAFKRFEIVINRLAFEYEHVLIVVNFYIYAPNLLIIYRFSQGWKRRSSHLIYDLKQTMNFVIHKSVNFREDAYDF